MTNTKETIKKHSLKLTSARESIIDILLAKKNPVCYEDIKDMLTINKATFYRNIATFEKKGIVNSFESNDKKRYYEIHTNHHGHFICSQCQNIECLEDIQPPNLQGYIVEHIIVHGYCQICQKK